MKKGFLLPTLRYFWFVLRPGELTYYKDSQQKDASGVIALDTNCWVDAASNGGKPDRRFILSTPEHKCIELVAEDHRGRLQWLSALQTAIQHSGDKIGYQRNLANQRRSVRQVCLKSNLFCDDIYYFFFKCIINCNINFRLPNSKKKKQD